MVPYGKGDVRGQGEMREREVVRCSVVPSTDDTIAPHHSKPNVYLHRLPCCEFRKVGRENNRNAVSIPSLKTVSFTRNLICRKMT